MAKQQKAPTKKDLEAEAIKWALKAEKPTDKAAGMVRTVLANSKTRLTSIKGVKTSEYLQFIVTKSMAEAKSWEDIKQLVMKSNSNGIYGVYPDTAGSIRLIKPECLTAIKAMKDSDTLYHSGMYNYLKGLIETDENLNIFKILIRAEHEVGIVSRPNWNKSNLENELEKWVHNDPVYNAYEEFQTNMLGATSLLEDSAKHWEERNVHSDLMRSKGLSDKASEASITKIMVWSLVDVK